MTEHMTSQSVFSFPDPNTQPETFTSFLPSQTFTSEPITNSQPNPKTSNTFQNPQFQQYHTATPSSNNAKFPYLKKDEYETWAMKMEYWIMNTDHNLWKVIQNGNNKKSLGRDSKGGIIILPYVSFEEHVAVQRETKARTLLLHSVPEDHMADFHHLDDAREIWLAVKARFGGNEESKKNDKTMLKQEFSEFHVVLPPSWSQVALTLKTRGGLEYLSFDDLYNKLRSLEIDVKGSSSYGSRGTVTPTYSAFIGATSTTTKMGYSDPPSHSYSITYPSSHSGSLMEDVDQIDMEELDIKWQMAMLSLRINKFQKKQCNVKKMDEKAWYSAFKISEVKIEEPKAMVSVDSMLNWNKHKAEHKPDEGEQVYGLMAGFKSDFADPAVNAAGSVYDAAAEFAMMGISPKVKNKREKDKIGTKLDQIKKKREAFVDAYGCLLNDPIVPECSYCGALYTRNCSCSKGSVEDKILVPKPPENYARCGHPFNGPYCQGCTLLREKLKEDLVTYFQKFQNTSKSSDGSTNVVNAPQEPFVVKQDHSVNPPHIDECCCECGEALDGISCQQYACKSCGKGFDQTQPPQFPVVHPPPQETSIEILHDQENVINSVQTFLRKFNRYSFFETPKVLLLAWDRVFEIKDAFDNKRYKSEDVQELFRKLLDDLQNIHEELAEFINSPSWNRPAVYDDNDYDVDYTIAITPVLSTEEPDNSLSMGDEHLDTLPAMKSDEVIKSSVENLVLILSKFKGIPDTMCDVHLVNNPTPLEAKDHFEIVINSNDDYSSSDDDSLYYENIEYVEASPHDSELVNLEVEKIVIPEDEEIKDDNLREKLLKVNLLIAEIEALKDNPTPSFEFLAKSSSTSSTPFHNSLPEFENFCFNLEEISSGSTTTQSDISLPEYDSFIFDLLNDQFPPTDRSDFTHEEFSDEFANIISPPEYECFYFGNLPDPGELISSLNSEIHENLSSTTRVNLPVEDDYSPLLAYVV
uniref:Ribonuclease H-like domain-containing protein n=1 Tax=Tanacetum cinerariifolium TaxID=118510 RepID=A0A6L2LTU3_TANCI|nr:ribonuclease H-like domain-containing protein [Tanacetum cinerariifolium]